MAVSPFSIWASTSVLHLSPLICGYVGENYGWHKGFGLATIGMLIGLAIFVAPTLVTQLLIGAGAVGTAGACCTLGPTIRCGLSMRLSPSHWSPRVISIRALSLGGVPDEVGRPPRASQAFVVVLVGIVVCIPLFRLFVSDFSIVRNGEPLRLMASEDGRKLVPRQGRFARSSASFLAGYQAGGGLVDSHGRSFYGLSYFRDLSPGMGRSPPDVCGAGLDVLFDAVLGVV